MGENTKIEWARHTFNAWEGCTMVSPGCANCYAAARNRRFGGGVAKNWGPGAPRRLTSVSNWAKLQRWNALAAGAAERPRVFVNSLADINDPEVPAEWLAKLYEQQRRFENLDFLNLTKRPELWMERAQAAHDAVCIENPALGLWLSDWMEGTAPSNVWVGTTVEDQTRAEERIPALIEIPACVRFLSCEPLLGNLDLSYWVAEPVVPWIDWVICGGESGPNARPMHPDWARSLRDQCAAARVPFFFKQWGEWYPGASDGPEFWLDERHGLENVPGKFECFAFPRQADGTFQEMGKIGKKAAGRLLDGVEHNAFPNAHPLKS